MDQHKKTQAVRRRAQGVQRIASILNAAEVVFTEMGYDEATTNHIAAQAGISPGSLYQFFSNKEEIVQALAARYTEELQRVYDSVFSMEAASLSLAHWLDQIIDGLVTFHLAHPAFLLLFSRNSSLSQFSSLSQSLQKEVQIRFEFGFQRRAPHLSSTQRILCATMSVQLFKAVLPLLLQAEEAERRLLMCELKTVLQRYLEPLLG
jgi:AcrR family transcriptional regulator